MFAVSKADTVDPVVEETRQQIIDLVQDFTIETTPGSAAKIADYRDHLRPGTRIANDDRPALASLLTGH